MRTVKILGREVTDATWTVLWDGVTVASGAVVAGPLVTEKKGEILGAAEQVIGTWTFEDNGATDMTEHSMSITINSGVINAGTLWFSTDGVNGDDATGSWGITDSEETVGPGYWNPYFITTLGVNSQEEAELVAADRSNILLNGAVPATTSDHPKGGTEENPTWNGWSFQLGAGDIFTCTGRCPAQWVAPV